MLSSTKTKVQLQLRDLHCFKSLGLSYGTTISNHARDATLHNHLHLENHEQIVQVKAKQLKTKNLDNTIDLENPVHIVQVMLQRQTIKE